MASRRRLVATQESEQWSGHLFGGKAVGGCTLASSEITETHPPADATPVLTPVQGQLPFKYEIRCSPLFSYQGLVAKM